MVKKLLLIVMSILLMTGYAYGAVNTPTNMRAATVTTVDSIRITFTVNWSAGVDSSRILNAADSTLVKKMTTDQDSTVVIGGLTQGTTYTWIALVDSAGVQSAPDSVTFTTADITQPAFSMDSSTSTTITVSVSESPADGDSLIIVTGPDSVAVVWSTTTGIDTTGFTVSGLTPFTQYIWRLKADSANAVRSSVVDTLWTQINIEQTPLSMFEPGRVYSHPVLRSDSWRATSSSETTVRYTSFSLQGTTDTDSSIVLVAAPYTNLFGYASGDSCNFTVLIYAGDFIEGRSSHEHYEVLVDSVNVSSSGAFGFVNSDSEASNLRLPVSEHYMVKLRADTDNAEGGTTVYLWQKRYKD